MSLLTIVQDVCNELGLTEPSVVITSADAQVAQMLALLNKEGQLLARRHTWQELKNEATFTTLAAESQGALTTLAGADFDRIVNNTVYNRTERRAVKGPIKDIAWQRAVALTTTSPYSVWRIRGGAFRMTPNPPASQTMAFEWMSANWCESSGGTGKAAFTVDTDVGVLPEVLLELALKWRWKQAQGLAYAEEYDDYEKAIADAILADGGATAIDMGEQRVPFGLGIPDGSWNL